MSREESSTINKHKDFVEWVSSELRDDCYCCKVKFKLFRRKHHCRKCGEVVCAPCSQKLCIITGYDLPVRVCLLCSTAGRESREPSVSESIKTIDSDDDLELPRRLTRTESMESFHTDSIRSGWIENNQRNECSICKVTFTMFRRKHHCRKCGEIVCHGCSQYQVLMVGHVGNVRICACCYQLTVANKRKGLSRAHPSELRNVESNQIFFSPG